MNSTAVFLATDRGYLIPAIVAAKQIREFHGPINPAIFIIVVGFSGDELAELNVEFDFLKIILVSAEGHIPPLPAGTSFRKSHITEASLLRLHAAGLIASRFENLIYIDCDVQVVGDINSLLSYQVADGQVLAATDQAFLKAHSVQTRWLREHTAALGLFSEGEYFNSGVIALRRSTLERKGPMALEYFIANTKLCVTYDQDALNAVFSGSRVQLSPKYNFTPEYWRTARRYVPEPAIIHFADRDKPWHRPVKVSLRQFAEPYDAVLDAHPVMARYASDLRRAPSSARRKPSNLKRTVAKVLFPMKLMLMRTRAAKLFHDSDFAVD